MAPDQNSTESGYPSGVSHENCACPMVLMRLFGTFVVVMAAVVARIADAMRWKGRLYRAGAAATQESFRMARTMEVMSPPVARYTPAMVSICVWVGSLLSNHRIIFVEMNLAVLGWAMS